MSSEEKLPEELKAFEAALASLTPSIDRLSRDRIMYLAGQAALTSSPKTYWYWPTAFAGMTAVAAILTVLLVSQPDIRIGNHVENPKAASYAEGNTNQVLPAVNRVVTLNSPEELEPWLAGNAAFQRNDDRRPAWAFELALSGRVSPSSPGAAARQAESDSRQLKPQSTPRQLFEDLFPGNPRYRM